MIPSRAWIGRNSWGSVFHQNKSEEVLARMCQFLLAT